MIFKSAIIFYGGDWRMRSRRKINSAAKILFLVFSVFAAVKLVSQKIEIDEKLAANQQIQKQLNAQITINNQLSEEIQNAGSDEFYEEIARSKLGYIRPGERVFIDASN